MRTSIAGLIAALSLLAPTLAAAQTGQSQTAYPIATTPYDGTERATGTQDGATVQLKVTDIAALAGTALPSTCIATSAADSGAGTMRACLAQANASPGSSWEFYAPNALVTLSSPLSVNAGVKIRVHCVKPITVAVGASINDNWTFAYGSSDYNGVTTGLGTVFSGYGFQGNIAPAGSPGAFTSWISFSDDSCGFVNTVAHDFGATNMPGLANSSITNDFVLNSPAQSNIYINPVSLTLEHNTLKNPGSTACEDVGADVAYSTYQPGNMVIEDEFCNGGNSGVGEFGFRFYATAGSILAGC